MLAAKPVTVLVAVPCATLVQAVPAGEVCLCHQAMLALDSRSVADVCATLSA